MEDSNKKASNLADEAVPVSSVLMELPSLVAALVFEAVLLLVASEVPPSLLLLKQASPDKVLLVSLLVLPMLFYVAETQHKVKISTISFGTNNPT